MNVLDQCQQARLRADGNAVGSGGHTAALEEEPYLLTHADRMLLGALREDARVSYAGLAAAADMTASTAARRLAELRARGALFFDVDVDPALMGVTVSALLWMQISPAHLDTVATALAGHEELALVAATTGPTNLVAHALCRDAEALHTYLTRRLTREAITHIETTPVLRTYKAAATLRKP
ncbi:DNA-binding Lrp family transcriptional regulator [Streptomyces sp. SAI-144]|uniref:Lrp/AsnC family transcriptional regulator n=1 Tax=Streptomyces sp. SAI-144 TaxID=2940544 RepID=UPI0024741561|nr:Lrp/AsnC family transcriptional regulator [Streptomyces sp. SAI-144]MDH6436841.1 DNA-binding Lrp family transcriptional regulator [Streptomyces sp. SAI-144]